MPKVEFLDDYKYTSLFYGGRYTDSSRKNKEKKNLLLQHFLKAEKNLFNINVTFVHSLKGKSCRERFSHKTMNL